MEEMECAVQTRRNTSRMMMRAASLRRGWPQEGKRADRSETGFDELDGVGSGEDELCDTGKSDDPDAASSMNCSTKNLRTGEHEW